MNENEKQHQNFGGTAKMVLRGKFTVLNAYIRKEEKSQINNLSPHLKNLEKQEHDKPKGIRKETTKSRHQRN